MNEVFIDSQTGYVITDKLNRIKEEEFLIYNKFLEVCEKYNIKFFAVYGSLLGAVRHKDMIPWDDDMDFGMLREDYEKLCSIADKEFTGKFFFQTGFNDSNYFFGYARLRNSETTGIITWFNKHPHNEGIYIDIFVFDKAPSNLKKVKSQMRNIRLNHFILNNYYYVNTEGIKKYLLFIPMKIIKILLPYSFFAKRFMKCCKKYSNDCSDIYYLAACPCPFDINWFKMSEINELIKVPFGKTYTYIPKSFDIILTRRYGNYMAYPPINERGAWHNNIITFDPDTPYREYEKRNNSTYSKLNKEYEKLKKKEKKK